MDAPCFAEQLPVVALISIRLFCDVRIVIISQREFAISETFLVAAEIHMRALPHQVEKPVALMKHTLLQRSVRLVACKHAVKPGNQLLTDCLLPFALVEKVLLVLHFEEQDPALAP